MPSATLVASPGHKHPQIPRKPRDISSMSRYYDHVFRTLDNLVLIKGRAQSLRSNRSHPLAIDDGTKPPDVAGITINEQRSEEWIS